MRTETRSALAVAAHFLEIQQPARALAALDAIAGPDLDDPWLWELRAQALVDLERYTSAAGAAVEGLAVEPDSIPLLDLLSMAYRELGRLGEAEKAILQALHLEPEHPVLLCRYAQLLAYGGNLAKAGRVLAEAERVDPDHEAVIRCRMALAYLRGDDKAAEAESRRLLAEVDPDDSAAHLMLGIRASSRGEAGTASRHFDTAARSDLGDEDMVQLARLGRQEEHPLFWPMRPVERYGPAKIWLGAVAVLALLRVAGQDRLLMVVAAIYVLFCAYSWIVPPLARRWLDRGWQ